MKARDKSLLSKLMRIFKEISNNVNLMMPFFKKENTHEAKCLKDYNIHC